MVETAAKPTAEETETEDAIGKALRNELLGTFLHQYQPAEPDADGDFLDERYVVDSKMPRSEFNTQSAHVYATQDKTANDAQLIAYVASTTLPSRYRFAKALLRAPHANMLYMQGIGITSIADEQKLAAIYEMPKGKTLSRIMEENKSASLPDNFIVNKIIGPITAAIGHCEALGFSHGRINADNVFFGDRVQLGECASEPCGYSQLPYYETLSRRMCHPMGKGEGTITHDIYALGILVAWLKYGASLFRYANPQAFLEECVRSGSYTALFGAREISENLVDFLRGTLNDNTHERWGLNQLKAFVSGKRYNLLIPSVPPPAARPFPIGAEEFASVQHVAHGLFKNWESAANLLRDESVSRWLDLAAKRKATAEAINRAVSTMGGQTKRNDRQNNELVSRCLTILDPQAPLRLKVVTLCVDGIGTMVAEASRAGDQQVLQYITDMIEQGLANIWADQQRRLYEEEELPAEVTAALWNLDRIRQVIRNTNLGFGMERALYDLNPDLPCQSKLLKGLHVQNIAQLLTALDRLAQKHARETVPFDRHIAAFVASRTGQMQGLTISEFAARPDLASNASYVGLKLLQQTQLRAGNPKLSGLSAWLSACILEELEHFHSNTLKKHIVRNLKQIATSGFLKPISELMLRKEYVMGDQEGFERAVKQYHFLADQIDLLKDPDVQNLRAGELGYRTARTIAVLIFLGTLLFVAQPYL